MKLVKLFGLGMEYSTEIEFVYSLIIELSRNKFSGDLLLATIGKHLN